MVKPFHHLPVPLVDVRGILGAAVTCLAEEACSDAIKTGLDTSAGEKLVARADLPGEGVRGEV